ncbi:VOC family protein [Acinetobacter faecalis]|uniref:VOC family protein n=1 Tax=Acinetobacter faecalis TaxID=2665161 RepID=UPI002A91B602|nr:VOC family protein [Acinetobacter faecalis]MDY6460278.1 VOC family protein [Acinetobacter faecalis]
MAKPIEIAQVTYGVPDLDVMEAFMTDFGLARVAKEENILYMRGSGQQHHIHVARKEEKQRFIGASIEVESKNDLIELSKLEGSSEVQLSSEPGDGYEVVMHMPDGFEIKAIWGRKKHEDVTERQAFKFNHAHAKPRVNAPIRIKQNICQAIKLGHFVLHVSNHDESVKWLQERFDLLPSDYFAPPGEAGPIVGTFLRFNHGDKKVDHHAILILQSDWVGVHHCSFEVIDLDAVMSAHDYLVSKGYQLDCGVGRHMLGSQIFDYWKDPFGFRVEHYTDGDMLDEHAEPTIFNGTAIETTQWGMAPTLEFFQ